MQLKTQEYNIMQTKKSTKCKIQQQNEIKEETEEHKHIKSFKKSTPHKYRKSWICCTSPLEFHLGNISFPQNIIMTKNIMP